MNTPWEARIVITAGLLIFLLTACATSATSVRTSDEGHFGMIVQPVNYEMAKRLGLKQPNGDLVTDVMSGGMAALAGIQTGDVITHFNGKMIHGSSKSKSDKVFIDHLQVPIGKAVAIDVLRDGEPVALTLKVTEPPKDPVERQRQKEWPRQIALENEKREVEAANAKRQAEAQAAAEAAERKEALRRECGDDFGKIRIGMSIDRLKRCWGRFSLFSLSGQINRADGVMSVYEVSADRFGGPGASIGSVIGVSAIYVIDDKIVGWTR